jgi:hypothetical protein
LPALGGSARSFAMEDAMTMKNKDVPTTEETAEMAELEEIIREKDKKAKLTKPAGSENQSND